MTSLTKFGCGNLKGALTFEHSTETFVNIVGVLAVREDAPYTVLREGFGRHPGGECYDWARKNKHRIFLNLEQENKEVPVRLKIAACAYLICWLKEQGSGGKRILEALKIGNRTKRRNSPCSCFVEGFKTS